MARAEASSAGRTSIPRVVLDTNVLIGAGYSRGSASFRILQACADGTCLPFANPALMAEYETIMRQALRAAPQRAWVESVVREIPLVPDQAPPVAIPADPQDEKVLAAAEAAGAGFVITNDHHLLDLADDLRWRIVRPGVFWEEWEHGNR